MSKPIETLFLPNRIEKSLKTAGINTVDLLAKMPFEELITVKGVGHLGVLSIVVAAAGKDIKLNCLDMFDAEARKRKTERLHKLSTEMLDMLVRVESYFGNNEDLLAVSDGVIVADIRSLIQRANGEA